MHAKAAEIDFAAFFVSIGCSVVGRGARHPPVVTDYFVRIGKVVLPKLND
jgi:hypothetical protein